MIFGEPSWLVVSIYFTMLKILITSSSFLETPGEHLQLLDPTRFETVEIPGPHDEAALVQIASSYRFDGIICGMDRLNRVALEAFSPSLKVISRCGVGVDRIDLTAASELGIAVHNIPRLNHAPVAELTVAFMIDLARKIGPSSSALRALTWQRVSGFELFGKTLAIFGFGMVGKRVAELCAAFGMNILIHNSSWNQQHELHLERIRSAIDLLHPEAALTVERISNVDEIFIRADFISLHMDLNRHNARFLNGRRLALCKPSAFVINVSRHGLVDEAALLHALRDGLISGYASDAVEEVMLPKLSTLIKQPNTIFTPSIGGRTFESVSKQGAAAARNILNFFALQT